ncbi:MAG: HAMP domain-containing histidine kinase [Gammaproteobacteria bacterium]|nr:HAMP domain-containing histidine kinase [Gammaproteobacteria bacterium]
MSNTLYKKLSLVLLGVMLFLGLTLVTISALTTPVFLQELNQRLHYDLAQNLVKETRLFENTQVNEKDWNKVFMGLMLVNPAIEVYLVSVNGDILAYSAPPGHVKLDAIDTGVIHHYLSGDELPILGDDPRGVERKKAFSAAPIYDGSQLQGYLYVVLGGEIYDSVISMLQSSYVSRMAIAAIVSAILIAFIAGLFTFRFITRRVRNLSQLMQQFKKSDFQQHLIMDKRFDGRPGDEIDELGRTFREMSERIIQQVKQLQHEDTMRRELIANVSHDLRTPLSSLQGYLETLSIKGDSLNTDERKHYVDVAFRHSQRLGRLISELFELSILESGSNRLHYEPFSMSELAYDVVQKFQYLASEKQISLHTSIPEQIPFVQADIALIERVIENLLDNAIKYTQRGGEVSLELEQKDGQLFISIADNGPGIDEKDIPHIFERFYRANKSRDDTESGTGLGLAITKRILQLHQSDVRVTSHINQGTQFAFPLPLHPIH